MNDHPGGGEQKTLPHKKTNCAKSSARLIHLDIPDSIHTHIIEHKREVVKNKIKKMSVWTDGF